MKEALSKLSRQQYSIEELTRKPLPEGVDPLRLEDYLSDQDFRVGHLTIKINLLLVQLDRSTSSCYMGSVHTCKDVSFTFN